MDFKKLPSNSKKLLDEILQADDPCDMLCKRFEGISHKQDEELRSLIRELCEGGYINVKWADGVPYYVTINNSARTYNEQLAEYEEEKRMRNSKMPNIINYGDNYGNQIFGNVSDSTLSVDNSVDKIERAIDERGGEDKEELHELLDEVKELIENIEVSRSIPKQKRLYQKISDHMEKHGWFYGAVVQLLGTVAMNLLGAG